jgi:hypothetical protein
MQELQRQMSQNDSSLRGLCFQAGARKKVVARHLSLQPLLQSSLGNLVPEFTSQRASVGACVQSWGLFSLIVL